MILLILQKVLYVRISYVHIHAHHMYHMLYVMTFSQNYRREDFIIFDLNYYGSISDNAKE